MAGGALAGDGWRRRELGYAQYIRTKPPRAQVFTQGGSGELTLG